MNKLLRSIQRNPINTAFGLAMVGCLVLSSGNVKDNFQTIGETKKITQFNIAKNYELTASQQDAESQAEIANQRYQSGCLMLSTNGKFVHLSQAATVIDPERKTPLPKGTLVCDSYGNTGRLAPRDFDRDGIFTTVITETAFTGNQEIISKAKQEAAKNGSFATPQ
jgi:hypothetical protein